MLFVSILLMVLLFKPMYGLNDVIDRFSGTNNSKLMKNGYLIIPNIVSHKDCDKILKIIANTEKKKAKYGNIHSNVNRKDMMLSTDKMKPYIKKIYNKTKYIWDEITPDPILCECSSLISYPGAYPQIWHTDTTYRKDDGNLVSIGVSLKDVTEDMGPLNVYEKSVELYKKDLGKLMRKNNLDIPLSPDSIDEVQHGLYNQVLSELCDHLGYKEKKCVTKKGDIVIWLSSVVHRGGINISDTDRPVFYFSLLSNKGTPPRGATYSLLKNRIHISDI